MADPQIRSMGPDDYPIFDRFDAALHRLHVEARADLFRPCEHPVSRKDFEAMFSDPHEELFLAEAGGRPAGICCVTLKEERNPLLLPQRCADIGDLYVSPEFRKRGIGTALIREAQRRARLFGAVRLSLMVWPFNQGAMEFYRRLGLEVHSYTMEIKL